MPLPIISITTAQQYDTTNFFTDEQLTLALRLDGVLDPVIRRYLSASVDTLYAEFGICLTTSTLEVTYHQQDLFHRYDDEYLLCPSLPIRTSTALDDGVVLSSTGARKDELIVSAYEKLPIRVLFEVGYQVSSPTELDSRVQQVLLSMVSRRMQDISGADDAVLRMQYRSLSIMLGDLVPRVRVLV